jgi:hypothetical protein
LVSSSPSAFASFSVLVSLPLCFQWVEQIRIHLKSSPIFFFLAKAFRLVIFAY